MNGPNDLTMLDLFAAFALAGMIAKQQPAEYPEAGGNLPGHMAEAAYRYGQAMMQVRLRLAEAEPPVGTAEL